MNHSKLAIAYKAAFVAKFATPKAALEFERQVLITVVSNDLYARLISTDDATLHARYEFLLSVLYLRTATHIQPQPLTAKGAA